MLFIKVSSVPRFKTKFYRVKDNKKIKNKLKSISSINNPKYIIKDINHNFMYNIDYFTTILKWNRIKIYKDTDLGRVIKVKREMCTAPDKNNITHTKSKYLYLEDYEFGEGNDRYIRNNLWYFFKRFKKGIK